MVAFKVDIEKAYDTVSWSFLKRTLSSFGFDESFLSKLMLCVQSSSYRVLISGSPSDVILPSRGLRQGDPLSPYLYIFCGEALLQTLLSHAKSQHIYFPRTSPSSVPIPLL